MARLLSWTIYHVLFHLIRGEGNLKGNENHKLTNTMNENSMLIPWNDEQSKTIMRNKTTDEKIIRNKSIQQKTKEKRYRQMSLNWLLYFYKNLTSYQIYSASHAAFRS